MYQHSADSVSGKKLVNDMTAILSCNEDTARMWCQQYNLQSLADLRDVAVAVSQTTQLCHSFKIAHSHYIAISHPAFNFLLRSQFVTGNNQTHTRPARKSEHSGAEGTAQLSERRNS